MKALCIKTCKVMINGYSCFVKKGEVRNIEEEHPCFTPIAEVEEVGIDFLTASEAALKAAKWKFSDAYTAIKDAFGVELNNEEGTKKSEVIKQILDARFRAVDLPSDPTPAK